MSQKQNLNREAWDCINAAVNYILIRKVSSIFAELTVKNGGSDKNKRNQSQNTIIQYIYTNQES